MKKPGSNTFKIAFPIACVWIGSQVGPALASGSTAANYFAKFGSIGPWMAILSQIFVAFFVFFGLENGRVYKAQNYAESYISAWGRLGENKVFAKIITVINDILTLISTFLTCGLMYSMLGTSVICALTGLSNTWGIILCSLIFLVCIMWGLGVLKALSTILTLMLAVCFLILYILGTGVGFSDPSQFIGTWNLPEGVGPAVSMCIGYIGIQYSFCKQACMFTEKFTSAKHSLATVIIGGAINALFLVISTINLWYFYPDALAQNAPHLWSILNYYPGWAVGIYYVTSAAACISTAITGLLSMTVRFRPIFFKKDSQISERMQNVILSIVLMVICAMVSLLGMNTIMGTYYSKVGTLALILGIVPYGILLPIRYFTTPKAERERLAARSVESADPDSE